jgi:hypothetical protein
MNLDCHVKNGRTIVTDEERSGHLPMSGTVGNTEQIHAIILEIMTANTDEVAKKKSMYSLYRHN